jgi:hypothetical protein
VEAATTVFRGRDQVRREMDVYTCDILICFKKIKIKINGLHLLQGMVHGVLEGVSHRRTH